VGANRARKGKPWIQTSPHLLATAPVLDPTMVQLELGDAAGLRLLAEQASCEQRGKLLRVFANIAASGTRPLGTRLRADTKAQAARRRTLDVEP
jgi:hypothetical protein